MKLAINKKLSNNNYEVTITLDDIQVEETELFDDFGKISINTGGELTKNEEDAPVATIGDSYKYLLNDFPINRVFTKAQYGSNAEAVAVAFADTMKKRIQSAITELKAKQDTFTGVTEVQL